MDAFLTCPLRDFNGVQIVDWGSWSWFWQPRSSLTRSEGKSRRGSGTTRSRTTAGLESGRSRISPAFAPGCSRRSPEKHRSSGGCSSRTSGTSCWLCMAKRILRATISGICMTPDTSSIAVAGPINCATPLRDIYVALDGAVGELLRAVDGRTTVMLVSGDGMGPNYSGSHLLEDVLIRIGAPTTAGAIETAGAREARAAHVPRDLASTIRSLVPQRLRMAVSDSLLSREMRERLSLRWKTAGRVARHSRIRDRKRGTKDTSGSTSEAGSRWASSSRAASTRLYATRSARSR